MLSAVPKPWSQHGQHEKYHGLADQLEDSFESEVEAEDLHWKRNIRYSSCIQRGSLLHVLEWVLVECIQWRFAQEAEPLQGN